MVVFMKKIQNENRKRKLNTASFVAVTGIMLIWTFDLA